jgi:hypothetical protein
MFSVRRLFDGKGWIRLLKLHDGVDPLVVAPKQGERERNVFFAMQVETDPPRVRYVMVRRDFAAGNEFIAHRAREREISHIATVKVADFPFADAKFATAEAMLSNGNVRPTQQLTFDCLADLGVRQYSSQAAVGLGFSCRCP